MFWHTGTDPKFLEKNMFEEARKENLNCGCFQIKIIYLHVE